MKICELEEHYLQKKLDGMDYSEIRNELKNKGLSTQEIRIIINGIDNKVISGLTRKTNKTQFSSKMLMGTFLLFGGLIVTMGTYSGWIKMGNYYILAWGPILSGIGLILAPSRKRSEVFDRKRKF